MQKKVFWTIYIASSDHIIDVDHIVSDHHDGYQIVRPANVGSHDIVYWAKVKVNVDQNRPQEHARDAFHPRESIEPKIVFDFFFDLSWLLDFFALVFELKL